MKQVKKKNKIVYQDSNERITLQEDGQYLMELTVTREFAAKFYEACNAISEELGRPVSKTEAATYMAKVAVEKLKAEAGEDATANALAKALTGSPDERVPKTTKNLKRRRKGLFQDSGDR